MMMMVAAAAAALGDLASLHPSLCRVARQPKKKKICFWQGSHHFLSQLPLTLASY